MAPPRLAPAAGVVAALLALPPLAGLGGRLERSPRWRPVRALLQRETVNPAVLAYGSLGRTLKRLGLVHTEIAERGAPPPAGRGRATREAETGRPLALRAQPAGPAGFAPSRAVASLIEERPAGARPPWPLLSMTIRAGALYAPQRGLLEDPERTGRDRERLAHVSFHERPRPTFASGVGLRLHGDYSSHPRSLRSFRLYFRRSYGMESIPGEAVFTGAVAPIRTLVVRTESPGFENAIAMDIAARIGALVPDHRVGYVLVGDTLRRPCFLAKHLSRRQWESELGHGDFYLRRFRALSDAPSLAAYGDLAAWALEHSAPLTLAAAEARLDVAAFTRHVLAIAYCGNADWMQGAALFDRRAPQRGWRWILWDMDHSFSDNRSDRRPWERESLELVATGHLWWRGDAELPPLENRDVRTLVFSRLVRDSAAYRELLARQLTEALNHLLTPAYLTSLLDSYERSFSSPRDLAHVRAFLEHRGGVVLAAAARLLDREPAVAVEVRAPAGLALRVDGHAVDLPYEGRYFPGQRIVVSMVDGAPSAWHWLVDGERLPAAELRHTVRGAHRIELRIGSGAS